MMKYKVRLTGLGIEAVAVMPFKQEPTYEELENEVAFYLNENLMKIEANNFYGTERYTITYEEIKQENNI